eukprot:COSAG02_NODE_951_length_15694_cov_15.969606_4_plen_167_part_00
MPPPGPVVVFTCPSVYSRSHAAHIPPTALSALHSYHRSASPDFYSSSSNSSKAAAAAAAAAASAAAVDLLHHARTSPAVASLISHVLSIHTYTVIVLGKKVLPATSRPRPAHRRARPILTPAKSSAGVFSLYLFQQFCTGKLCYLAESPTPSAPKKSPGLIFTVNP